MFKKLTEEEQAEKDARKQARREEQARAHAAAEAARRERFAAMDEYVIRETREVTVKAKDLPNAISLASVAFLEGQDHANRIKWGRPFGVEGDTVDKIRVISVKGVEL